MEALKDDSVEQALSKIFLEICIRKEIRLLVNFADFKVDVRRVEKKR